MRDDAIDVRVQRILAAASAAFPHIICGVLRQATQGDATVIRIIRIIPAAISNRGDGVRAIHGIIPRAVHRPRSTFQGFALGIDLIPFDRGAGGGIRTIPRQIVALLIHIQCGSGMATFVVDEQIEFAVLTSIAHRIRVVHGERPADPYAAVGTHMRFKAAVRYENAAEHARSRVIVGFHGERAIPHAIIPLSCRILDITSRSTRTLTTADDYIARIRKVPHNLLSALGVSVVGVGAAQFTGLIIHISPPEAPAVVEIHVSPGHVNDHRRGVRNIREAKAHAGIRQGIVKHACRQIEHLHGRRAIAYKLDDLLMHAVDGEGIASIELRANKAVLIFVI